MTHGAAAASAPGSRLAGSASTRDAEVGRAAAPAAGAPGLRRLVAGNRRFVARERLRAGTGHSTLAQMAEGQQPFATILGLQRFSRSAGAPVRPGLRGPLRHPRGRQRRVGRGAGEHSVRRRPPPDAPLHRAGPPGLRSRRERRWRPSSTGRRRTRKGIRALLRSILPGLDGIDPALPSMSSSG